MWSRTSIPSAPRTPPRSPTAAMTSPSMRTSPRKSPSAGSTETTVPPRSRVLVGSEGMALLPDVAVPEGQARNQRAGLLSAFRTCRGHIPQVHTAGRRSRAIRKPRREACRTTQTMYAPDITGYATLAEVRNLQTQPAGTFPVAGTMACLPGRMLLDTTDPDEVTAVIGELVCEHKLLVEGPAAQFHAQVRDCAVGDLRLAHFNYGTAFTVKSQPLGRYVVNFTINGLSRVRLGRAAAVAGSGQATVLSPRAESELTWTPETDVLSLVVPKAALEEHFRRLSGIGSGEIVFEPQIGNDTAHPLTALIGAALVRSGGGLFDVPEAVSWQMRDAILTAMLLELRHDHSELLTSLRGSGGKRLCEAAASVMRRQLASA